jgi:hypothetical protein
VQATYAEDGIDVGAHNDRREAITISLRPRKYFRKHGIREISRHRGPVICVHDLCWEVFTGSSEPCPLRFWYNLMLGCQERGGQMGKPRNLERFHFPLKYKLPEISDTLLYQPETLEGGYKVFLSRIRLSSKHLVPNSGYSSAFLAVMNLSPELRLHVWKNLDEESWTARVLSTLSRVPEAIAMHDRHIHGPLSYVQLGNFSLSSYSCDKMGISYLSCVHIETTGASTCCGTIQIPVHVSIIEVVHGYFGVSTVRFYIGDKKSDWLGVLNHRSQYRWHRYIKNQAQSPTILFRGDVRFANDATLETQFADFH